MQLPVEHKVILFSDLRIRADSLQYIIKEWKCYIFICIYTISLRSIAYRFRFQKVCIKHNLIVDFEHIHGYSYEHWLFQRAFDVLFCILYVDPWFRSMQGIQTIGSRIISSMILQILIQGNPSRWEVQIKMPLLLTGKIHNHQASRPLAQKHHVVNIVA